MALDFTIRFGATLFAIAAGILSFTVLLSRYNGAPDREFPILLSEYFEINPRRNERIVDIDRRGLIRNTTDEFAFVWDKFFPVSSIMAMDEASLKALQGSQPESLIEAQQVGIATAVLSVNKGSLVGTGPIGAGYDIYREDFQSLLGAFVQQKLLPASRLYDPESPESKKSYAALESTLGVFTLYSDARKAEDVEKSQKLTAAAAESVVLTSLEEADRLFEKLRIGTRVAVAMAVIGIVASCINITLLLVNRKTYIVVALQIFAAAAGGVFLGMMQLNANNMNELLALSFQTAPPANPGPAVYGAGFMMAFSLVGAVVSGVHVYRRLNYAYEDDESELDEEESVAMEEVSSSKAKTEEAKSEADL